MANTKKKLHRTLQRTGSPLGTSVRGKHRRLDAPSIEDFIRQGLDPVHAAYTFVQHITSHFAEGVSQIDDELPLIIERLRSVQFMQRPAIEVIQK